MIKRKLISNVGSTFSDLLNILFGVPRGSILVPFLFIICNGIEFGSHADVTTSFFYGKHLTEYTEYLVKCLP